MNLTNKLPIILRRSFSKEPWNLYWPYPVLLFIATIVSRIPFTSKLLYEQDSVQFALGIRQYDVYLHQPNPPGYFVYVMAGRLINFLLQDANASLLLFSIVGSGLTVAVVYHLGTLVFDRETGLCAAALAFTSPLLWYYGELALTYAVAAALNTWIAILCWNLLQKQRKYFYLTPIVFGISAGIRQDLAVFLFPLWLFCIAHLPWKQILAAGVILGITVASWFIPMLIMTGGPARYFLAIREYWLFHVSTYAIWNAGLESRLPFLLGFFGHLSYGLGIGAITMCLSLYSLVRNRDWRTVSTEKVFFFFLWLFPAFAFQILVYMVPAQAGHSVFFLPPLFVLFWPGLRYLFAQIAKVLRQPYFASRAICLSAASLVVITNALFFLFSGSVASAKGIQQHDNNLSEIFQGIERHFSPTNTIIIDAQAYTLYSYRHIQYYLPSYRVYLTALSNNKAAPWHTILGYKGRTFITKTVNIAPNVRYIVYLTNPFAQAYSNIFQADNLHRLLVNERNVLFYKEVR